MTRIETRERLGLAGSAALVLVCFVSACDKAAVPRRDAGREPGSDAGADAGGSSVDAASDAAMDAGTDAGTDAGIDAGTHDAGVGPCGSHELFFGAPTPFAAFPSTLAQGHLSPDGRSFAGSAPANHVRIYRRAIPTGASWSDTVYDERLYEDLTPHLSSDQRDLVACHGGEYLCASYHRAGPETAFAPMSWYGTPFVDGEWGRATAPPTDTDPLYLHLTPAPGFDLFAFSANRRSVAETQRHADVDDFDVWTASAVDPDDLGMGLVDFQRHADASSPGDDQPEWLSDDGLVLLFLSDRDGDFDVWQTARATPTALFGEATRIAALSEPDTSEDAVTIPSYAALEERGCRLDGYLRRSDGAAGGVWHRFAVCLGRPCP